MDDFSFIVNNLIKEDDEGVAFHALSSNCLVIFGFLPVGSDTDDVSEPGTPWIGLLQPPFCIADCFK